MRTSAVDFLAVVLAVLAATGRADVGNDRLGKVLPHLPACGRECATHVYLNFSAMMLNASVTCPPVGHVETYYGSYSAVYSCLKQNCSEPDLTETLRVSAEYCGEPPWRSRRGFVIATISVGSLAFACTLLRIYSRWTMASHFAADDYTMMAAMVLFMALVIMTGLCQRPGHTSFGVDVWTIEPSTLTWGLKLLYICEILYIACLSLTKLAIISFFLRIFPNRSFRLTAFAVMAWVALEGFVIILASIFQCIPVDAAWNKWEEPGAPAMRPPPRCINMKAIVFSAAANSIAQNLVVLVLPVPLVLRLNSSRRDKIEVLIMFSLGIFVLITSCIRLRYVLGFGSSINPSWDYTPTVIWSDLELIVSIIVADLPAVRLLFNRKRAGSKCSSSSSGEIRTDGARSSAASGMFVLHSKSNSVLTAASSSYVSSHNQHFHNPPCMSAQDRLFAMMAGPDPDHLDDGSDTETGPGDGNDAHDYDDTEKKNSALWHIPRSTRARQRSRCQVRRDQCESVASAGFCCVPVFVAGVGLAEPELTDARCDDESVPDAERGQFQGTRVWGRTSEEQRGFCGWGGGCANDEYGELAECDLGLDDYYYEDKEG